MTDEERRVLLATALEIVDRPDPKERRFFVGSEEVTDVYNELWRRALVRLMPAPGYTRITSFGRAALAREDDGQTE